MLFKPYLLPRVKRHSKSLDVTRYGCVCGGRFQLLISKRTATAAKAANNPNSFIWFVKENFGKVKKDNPELSHHGVMEVLSTQWKEKKLKVCF